MAEVPAATSERAGGDAGGSSEMPEAPASESGAAGASADDRLPLDEIDLLLPDAEEVNAEDAWNEVWKELQAIGVVANLKPNFERIRRGEPVDDPLIAYVLLKHRAGGRGWVQELERQERGVPYRGQNSKVHPSGTCIFFSHKTADTGHKRPRSDDGWLSIKVGSVGSTRGAVQPIGTNPPYEHEGVLRISCTQIDRLPPPERTIAMFSRVAFSAEGDAGEDGDRHPEWESLGDTIGKNNQGKLFRYLDLDESRQPLCLVICQPKLREASVAAGDSSASVRRVRPSAGSASMNNLLSSLGDGSIILDVPDIKINGVSVWTELQEQKKKFKQLLEEFEEFRVRADMAELMQRLDADELIEAADLREEFEELRSTPFTFTSVRADMAEWMQRLDVDELIEAADLVECRGQCITKTITGEPGSTLFVVSTEPALSLNQQADEEEQQKGNVVAFLGRVPVRVVGLADVGSFLVPSGKSDGRAKCVSSDELNAQQLRAGVFGVVWALLPPDERGEERVLAFVCAHPTLPPFGAIHGAEELAPLGSCLVPCEQSNKVLRDYQQECVKEALKSNKIIHLPTGAGKTLVAARVIDKVRAQTTSTLPDPPQQLVLFIVPRVPLVSQQAEKLRRDCDGSPVVAQLIGKTAGGWRGPQWEACLSRCDILVGTPEVFRKAMEDGFVRIFDFSLIVVDECHHARKEHPMAKIMRDYFWPLRKPAAGAVVSRVPRVLGLTASFASGKVVREGQIEALRQELETTLSAQVFSPTSFKSSCKQDFFKVSYQSTSLPDGSREAVSKRIAWLTSGFNSFRDVEDTKAVEGAMHVLEECGWAGLLAFFSDSLAYQLENKAADLKAWSTKVAKSRDPAQAAQADSMKLKAQQLQDRLADFRQQVERVQAGLRSRDDELASIPFISGKCSKLLERLLLLFEAHQHKSRYKGIVFVERVALSWPLAEIINEHPSCVASGMVATSVSGGSSMSEAKQKDRIDSFKRGEVRVLVCTSVLEEGIDVPDCEFVVRYSGFDTTIEHIQGAGRARMPQAQIFYLENEPEEEIARAQQLTQCAEDDSLALSPAERALRVQLMRIPGFYPFSPPGEGTFTLDLDNCVRRFEEYCDRVLGSGWRTSQQLYHSCVKVVASVEVERLHTVKYPTLPDCTLATVTLDDVHRHWGEVSEVDVNNLLSTAAQHMSCWERLRHQFLYTVVVQMYERGHIDKNGYPVEKPASPTQLWIGLEETEVVSKERATYELRSDVFDPAASPATDGADTEHVADTHASDDIGCRGLPAASDADTYNSDSMGSAAHTTGDAIKADADAANAATANGATADDVVDGKDVAGADSSFADCEHAATPTAADADTVNAGAKATNASALCAGTTAATADEAATTDAGVDCKVDASANKPASCRNDVDCTDAATVSANTADRDQNVGADRDHAELHKAASAHAVDANFGRANIKPRNDQHSTALVAASTNDSLNHTDPEDAASADAINTGNAISADAVNADRTNADTADRDITNAAAVEHADAEDPTVADTVDGVAIVSHSDAATPLGGADSYAAPASMRTYNAIAVVKAQLEQLGKKMESFLEESEASGSAVTPPIAFGRTIRARGRVLAISSGSPSRRAARHAAFAQLLGSDEWEQVKAELLDEHTKLCRLDAVSEVNRRLAKLGLSLANDLRVVESGKDQRFGCTVTLVDGLTLGNSTNHLSKKLAKRAAFLQVLQRIDWSKLELAPAPRVLGACFIVA